MFIELLGRAEAERVVTHTLFSWIHAGSYTVDMAFTFDPLSAVFVLLITGVGSLIHIYSVCYMAHDPRRRLFFAYLNLFIAAMLMLALASVFLVMFLGWEGVGLSSYLLIGFWWHKPVAAAAAKKRSEERRVGKGGGCRWLRDADAGD